MAVRVQPPAANPVQYRVPGPRLASGGQDRAVPLRQQSLAAELAALRQEGEIPTTEQSLFEAINAGFDKWHEGALRVDEMNAAVAERKAEDQRHEEKLKADFYKEALRFQEKGQAGEGKAKKTLLQEETENWNKSVVGKRNSFWATPRLRVSNDKDFGILATGSTDTARANDPAANAYLKTRLTKQMYEKDRARFGAALSIAISNNLNHQILRKNFPILDPNTKEGQSLGLANNLSLLTTIGTPKPQTWRASAGGTVQWNSTTGLPTTGQQNVETNRKWQGGIHPSLERALASAEFDRLLGSTAATGNTLPDQLGAALNAWQHFNSTREKRDYTEYETLIESLFSRFGGAMWDGVKGAGKLAGGALLAPIGLAGRFAIDKIPGFSRKPKQERGSQNVQPAHLMAPGKPDVEMPRLENPPQVFETPPMDKTYAPIKGGVQMSEVDLTGERPDATRKNEKLTILDFIDAPDEIKERMFKVLTRAQLKTIFGHYLGKDAQDTLNNLAQGDE